MFRKILAALTCLILVTGCADASVHVGGRGPGHLVKSTSGSFVGTPGVLPFTYDTSIGSGVDANGFANLPLRAGASRYYVNSATGSDSNSCPTAKSASTPKATMASAATCLVAGNGDQMLVAEGTSYSEPLPQLNISGFNAVYPTVVESYDPTDPANEAKMGRGDQRNARPVINTSATQSQTITCCQTTPAKFIAIKGFKWGPGNVSDQQANITASNGLSNHYILVENNVFAYTMLAVGEDNRDPAKHIVVRGNSFYGSWDVSAHAQGIYADGCSACTIEDNFFYHIGWKIGGNRDDATNIGGPTIFRHAIYQQDSSDVAVRRNYSADPSATSYSLRGNVDAYGNLSVDAPIAFIGGEGTNYNYAQRNGVWLFIHHNAIIGDADINTANPRGGGIQTGNGKNGSKISYNLLARTRSPSAVNVAAFITQAGYNQPSYADFHDNVEYQWAAAGQVVSNNGAFAPAQTLPTFENNAWSDAASGSNVNIASHATPTAYTAASLYTTLGFADKAAAIARWQDHPEDRPAKLALTLLRTGYAVAPQTTEDLALSKSSFILTGAYTGMIMGAEDGSTLTTSGMPACFTIDGPSRSYTYDGTCSTGSGTFSITETPPTGSTHTTTISYLIAASPTLVNLALSAPLVSGTPSNGTFVNAYGGSGDSWIDAQSLPAGFSLDSTGSGSQGNPSRTWAYDGTPLTTGTFTVREFLNGATNSPHSSTISYGGSTLTWDTVALDAASYTFSGGNLIAARNVITGDKIIRGSSAKTSGSFSIVVSGTTGSTIVGLTTSSQFAGDFLGDQAYAIGYFTNGQILYGGSLVATGATWTNGDTIEVDWTGTNAVFKKNGVTQATVDVHTTITNAYPAFSANQNGVGVTLTPISW